MGAFVAVVKKYPNSQEAKKTRILLENAEKLLIEIFDLQKKIQQSGKKIPEYTYSDRRVAGVDISKNDVLDDNRLSHAYQIIAKNWVEMRNYPRAIQTYKTLVREIPHQSFVVAIAFKNIANLHMQKNEYERAMYTYKTIIEKVPKYIDYLKGEPIYQQAVCFHVLQKYTEAYKGYKAYIRFTENDTSYLQKAKQIVNQFEQDQDMDGFYFYVEEENGTSDQDPNSHPRIKN